MTAPARVTLLLTAALVGCVVGTVIGYAWPRGASCVCADTDGATAAGESPLWGAP